MPDQGLIVDFQTVFPGDSPTKQLDNFVSCQDSVNRLVRCTMNASLEQD